MSSAASVTRTALLQATTSFCSDFSHGAPVSQLVSHFSSHDCAILEHGPSSLDCAPFLGREFKGHKGVREYIALLGSSMRVVSMRFPSEEMLVDEQQLASSARGHATFQWLSTSKEWSEEIAYRLEWTRESDTLKLKRYEIWAGAFIILSVMTSSELTPRLRTTTHRCIEPLFGCLQAMNAAFSPPARLARPLEWARWELAGAHVTSHLDEPPTTATRHTWHPSCSAENAVASLNFSRSQTPAWCLDNAVRASGAAVTSRPWRRTGAGGAASHSDQHLLLCPPRHLSAFSLL